jgi:hypothetical protein
MEEVDLIIETDSEKDKESIKLVDVIKECSIESIEKEDNEDNNDSDEGSEQDEEDEEDLDTSWIENEEFRNNYEREPMKDLVVFFVYIDKHTSIEKIIKENIEIDDCSLSKEKLLHLIQTKRHRADGSIGKKYKLMDLMEFHVPLEPDELEGFVREDCLGRYLKQLPIFQSVTVDPSIFIFHDLNSLFFFFKEVENPVKSILKTGLNGVSGRVTKKVRLDTGEYLEKKRKSMKRMMRSVRKTRKGNL